MLFDMIKDISASVKAKFTTKKLGDIEKRPNRRKVQNANRSANKFGLKPFVPTLSLTEINDVNRLSDHVQGLMADLGGYNPDDTQEQHEDRENERDLARTNPLPTFEEFSPVTIADSINDEISHPLGSPANGYDYRRDVLTNGQNAIKPKGSNAWPWNRKLACCNQNEKTCTCGVWRRYS
jgi:hypothetical protein